MKEKKAISFYFFNAQYTCIHISLHHTFNYITFLYKETIYHHKKLYIYILNVDNNNWTSNKL
jgi:hypothetical protein